MDIDINIQQEIIECKGNIKALDNNKDVKRIMNDFDKAMEIIEDISNIITERDNE